MSSFDRQRTVPFTTRRPPARVGGRQGAPVDHLTSATLRCTPLDPADADTTRRAREQLGRDVDLRETYTAAFDIIAGDVLVVAGREYPIYRAESWDWRGTPYLRLLVEAL